MLVSTRGRAQLHALARRFRRAGDEKLRHELDVAGDRAGKHIADEVRRDTDIYMPRGYEAVWRRALITKVQQRVGAVRVITVSGRGFGARGHDRQARELELGHLRHPVFGRHRDLKAGGIHVSKKNRRKYIRRGGRYANPWVEQAVKPHWFTEPADHATPRAVNEIDAAAGRVAHYIARGI